jgi:enterochelin esterase-like enzyme
MLRLMLGKRDLLRAAAGAVAAAVAPPVRGAARKAGKHDSPHYRLEEVPVDGGRRFGKRMVMLVPRHGGEAKLPLAVLLHGYGESKDERAGVWAWVERYGLADAYRRLREPPVLPVLPKLAYWTDARLVELNRSLEKRPFLGLVFACPFVPNVYGAADRARWLDDYARFLVDAVVPRAREAAPALADTAHTSLNGVSMGGYVGIEVFLRKPEHFGAWGSLQGAFAETQIDAYARRLAEATERVGPRPLLLETSSADTYRRINERLSRALRDRGVPHDFVMPPGPHTQPFLQESGTVEMILWHDRLAR